MGGTAWKTLGERIEEVEQERAKAEQEKVQAEQEKAKAEQEKQRAEKNSRIYKKYFIQHLTEEEIAEKENISVSEVREVLELE